MTTTESTSTSPTTTAKKRTSSATKASAAKTSAAKTPAAKTATPKAAAAKVAPPKADGDISHRRDIKLGYLIHDVSRMRRTAFDMIVKPLGITRAQWWVIAHLSRHDGMAQTQLADMLDVGKASLGALLDRLEATEFIVRRPDPVDRRIKRIFMTKGSQQLLEKLVAAESAFNARILGGMSDKDRNELVRLLSTVKESMIKMNLSPEGGDEA